jgi:hypothetical protein
MHFQGMPHQFSSVLISERRLKLLTGDINNTYMNECMHRFGSKTIFGIGEVFQ